MYGWDQIRQASSPWEAAAMFWTDAVQNPKFESGNLNADILAWAIMEKTPEQAEANLRQFTEILADTLLDGLAKHKFTREAKMGYSYFVRVDYEPDTTLYQAAVAAGLNHPSYMTSWPSKTITYITEKYVEVYVGYAGKTNYIIWGVK
jgi:hypothetical protein